MTQVDYLLALQKTSLATTSDCLTLKPAISTVSDRLFNGGCKNGIRAQAASSAISGGWAPGLIIIPVRGPIANSRGLRNAENALDNGESFLLITYLRKACV
jgi:hypothetical protein